VVVGMGGWVTRTRGYRGAASKYGRWWRRAGGRWWLKRG